MYNGLDHKTARGLLNRVIKVVLDTYYDNPDDFLENIIKDIAEFIKIPNWQVPSHERILRDQAPSDFEKIALLVKLWGNGTVYRTVHEDNIYIGNINYKIFELFNLPVIEGIYDKDSNKQPGQIKPNNVQCGKENSQTVTTGVTRSKSDMIGSTSTKQYQYLYL